jgi:diadenosine tetraphosphate (Ap4A) HIT family hydrolase
MFLESALGAARIPLDMAEGVPGCTLCRGPEGDKELERVQVWEDRLWRLTTARGGELAGFSYLEPKRHIPHITDLDGVEARTFGAVLARTTSAIRNATGAEVVYVYVFGDGIPHLHLHLAPHRRGDPLSDRIIRGELVETPLPSGATSFVSREFPQLPASQHEAVRERLARALNDAPAGE